MAYEAVKRNISPDEQRLAWETEIDDLKTRLKTATDSEKEIIHHRIEEIYENIASLSEE